MNTPRTFSVLGAFAIVLALVVASVGWYSTNKDYKREIHNGATEIALYLGSHREDAELAIASLQDRQCTNEERQEAQQHLARADALAVVAGGSMLAGEIGDSYSQASVAQWFYSRIINKRCASELPVNTDGGAQ